jgi:hypothetical protein
MKKLFTLLMGLIFTANSFSQTPEKMSYQAVIRNSSDQLIANHTVGMRISILQGSATGIPVYVETQTPVSNANGLVTLEIGGGTIVSGTFAGIDWSNGTYFIKTETDPTGGTNYTITGVSQILSVPYAFYAKTAKTADYNDLTNKPVLFDGTWLSLTGKPTTLVGYGIQDGMSTSHVANGITSSMITNWNAAYGWGNHATAGYVTTTGVQILTNKTLTSPVINSPTGIVKADIGLGNVNNTSDFLKPISYATQTALDLKENTLTFSEPLGRNENIISLPAATPTSNGYLTSTDKTKLDGLQNADGSETKVIAGTNVTVTGAGTTTSPYIINSTAHHIGESYGGGIIFYIDGDGQHGLIAAPADQSTGIQWLNNATFTVTNAVRDGIGSGNFNTERIFANQGKGSYAAQICASYQGGGYGDWYLPSKYELYLLYLQKAVVGGFANSIYWSSSEYDNTLTWYMDFSIGMQFTDFKSLSHNVRAVRTF